jgi:CPA2 family monovalent cation:H+ antiporter-2
MHDYPLIATVSVGFFAAWVLGLVTQRLRLSPIVGYLIAGVLIGPHTPGFVGDIHLAHQLAEVGVILLMFGVGLHFHLDDLLAVRNVAIPGALGQSLAATLVAIVVFMAFGMEARTGAVIGMAMAVASTVVLMRVLMDANALNSPAGHVAVGWLLVEDVLTVIVLVLIPVLGTAPVVEGARAAAAGNPLVAIGMALLKLAALVVIVMVVGSRVIPWVLNRVARLRSRELFTLTVMVFSIAIAAGSYAAFGASMALGAFLAGMVVAQSSVSHQAAADALPLRDAFAVLFFVAVGMLFDPAFLIKEPLMMLAALGIILIVKPLAALAIVAALGYSVRTALTVAIGLAQIGEFSFILSDVGRKYGLMSDAGHNLLVGGAILSITLNPILFRSIDSIERWLKARPRLWALLNARAERGVSQANVDEADRIAGTKTKDARRAVVIGFGPVGRTVERLLKDAGLETVVIDMNLDTVAELRREGRSAIYGDASQPAILESAGVGTASHLLLTLPQANDRAGIVAAARNLNPKIKIFVRARYLREREELEQVGATAAVFEEGEAAVALARLVLADSGAGRESIDHAVRGIRTRLILENVNNLRSVSVRNVMVPWTRVRRLSSAMPLDEVRRKIGEQRYSRWPVVDAESGKPVGYLLAKDLIGFAAAGNEWTSLIRKSATLPPDGDMESALQQFQSEGATLCMVIDRGSPIGIVTVEDVLEQVVGRLEDEYPHHPSLPLSEIVIADEDSLNLSSGTGAEAVAELASRIPSGKLPPGVNIAELALAREREMSTNLGRGIAIPHARCPGLAQPIVMFGRSLDGIEFEGSSAEPVRLMFLLVTPAEQSDLQVMLLSRIAGLAGDAETRKRLREAPDAAAVSAVIAAADHDRAAHSKG